MNETLENTITKSQHCQRNWDLSKNITEKDLQTLKVAVSQCPSKQNRVFYKVAFVTNRKLIEDFHDLTDCFVTQWNPRIAVTNSQVLANLLVVFMRDRNYNELPRTENEESMGIVDGKDITLNDGARVDEDRAVGVAAGYLTLTANMLGYKTGFYNAQNPLLKNMFGSAVLLAVGVGFEDKNRNLREHHNDPFFKFPFFDKSISIQEVN